MSVKRAFYLREWRKHRGLTQEQLASRLDTSKGYISDLERGVRRYNQDILESLAEALNCTPADFLIRDPSDPTGIWSAWDRALPGDKPRIAAVVEAMVGKKTGTNS